MRKCIEHGTRCLLQRTHELAERPEGILFPTARHWLYRKTALFVIEDSRPLKGYYTVTG